MAVRGTHHTKFERIGPKLLPLLQTLGLVNRLLEHSHTRVFCGTGLHQSPAVRCCDRAAPLAYLGTVKFGQKRATNLHPIGSIQRSNSPLA